MYASRIETKSLSSQLKTQCRVQDLNWAAFNWKQINNENLHLDYTKIFNGSLASKIFQRLESEITYFPEQFLKVNVFGKWHEIPRKQVYHT